MLNPLPACKRFLSTPSARRATKSLAWLLALVAYFYPRPPRGGRQELTACIVRRDLFLSTPSARRATAGLLVFHLQWQEFLSTPSARRATINFPRDTTLKQHFYPRPPRGGRPYSSSMSSSSTGISIHALREEGDGRASSLPTLVVNFYPRPPRGGRLSRLWAGKRPTRFLSTPSARRATENVCAALHLRLFLSTPSARRATPTATAPAATARFLSTPSARRATGCAGI